MPRPARRDIAFPGGVYHIYAQGNDRMEIFRDAEDYARYLDDIAKLKAIHGILLFHYALMPSQVNLLLCSMGDGLSTFMKTLQASSAKRFCHKRGFAGHVWQGRFKSRLVDNDVYLLACGNHIEMNPVRAGLVAGPELWPYSSYRAYAYGEGSWLISRDPFFPNLGPTERDRQSAYRRLVSRTKTTSVPTVPGTVVSVPLGA